MISSSDRTLYIIVYAYIIYDIMGFGEISGYQETWSTMISYYDIIVYL